jgi:precorrin-2/cobalt-factor-2 C20-methyltransferase
VIPGIMATNAVAARIGFSLVEADERMLVLPLPSPVKELDGYRGLVDCVVLYKIGSRLDELAEWVRGRNLDSRAHIVVGAGLPRERCGLLTEMGPDVTGYLSVAVIYMETAPDSWSRGRHSGYVNAHSSAPSSVDATGRYDDFGR